MKHLPGFLLLLVVLAGCDQGLKPVAPDPVVYDGEIHAHITYVGEWPAEDQIHDLRFVAMRFIPESESDLFRADEMEISDRLKTRVDRETVRLKEVHDGTFYYSGVAWRFTSSFFDWRIAGLYVDNGGEFTVNGDIVEIDIVVDFANLPDFPP